MAGMLKRVAPLSYEAWIDYDVCGAPLSRMELDVLRTLVSPDGRRAGLQPAADAADPRQALLAAGLSTREADELLPKLRPDERPRLRAGPRPGPAARVLRRALRAGRPQRRPRRPPEPGEPRRHLAGRRAPPRGGSLDEPCPLDRRSGAQQRHRVAPVGAGQARIDCSVFGAGVGVAAADHGLVARAAGDVGVELPAGHAGRRSWGSGCLV